jgi:hypothetical protein
MNNPNDGPARPGNGSRFLENLAYLVPGYRGYKERELRREEDSRLRGRVLAKLQLIRGLVEERILKLTEQSTDAAVEAFARRLRRVEGIADAVRYAPYGFSGFFDAVRIREETLEKLLETDLLLFQDLDESFERLRGTPFPPRSKQTMTAYLEAFDSDIQRIETRLVTRDKILGDG